MVFVLKTMPTLTIQNYVILKCSRFFQNSNLFFSKLYQLFLIGIYLSLNNTI